MKVNYNVLLEAEKNMRKIRANETVIEQIEKYKEELMTGEIDKILFVKTSNNLKIEIINFNNNDLLLCNKEFVHALYEQLKLYVESARQLIEDLKDLQELKYEDLEIKGGI